MSRINTKVQICNLSLGHLNAGSVADIDDPKTQTEKVCDLHYDTTRLEVLRKHSWNFASKRIKLASDATFTPAFEFEVGYKLPNDFVRLNAIGTRGDVNLYQMEESRILISGLATDSTTQELPIKYVFDHTTVRLFDTLFIKLLALQMASNMAFQLTGTASHVDRLESLIKKAEAEAYAVDGQERPPERIEKSRFLGARRGNIGNSNTNDRPDLVLFNET